MNTSDLSALPSVAELAELANRLFREATGGGVALTPEALPGGVPGFEHSAGGFGGSLPSVPGLGHSAGGSGGSIPGVPGVPFATPSYLPTGQLPFSAAVPPYYFLGAG
jgi:hypothetical protein